MVRWAVPTVALQSRDHRLERSEEQTPEIWVDIEQRLQIPQRVGYGTHPFDHWLLGSGDVGRD